MKYLGTSTGRTRSVETEDGILNGLKGQLNSTRAALLACCAALSVMSMQPVQAEGSADLAKQLSNPIASLISVPFQLNYDSGFGPSGDGSRLLMNVQPVVPFALNANWNIISRTIVPLDNRDFSGTGYDFGVGDIVQSLFFSPSQPTANGLTWGVGPVFLLPSGSDFSADTWGAGITGVALKQSGALTYGALANHIWDVSGDASINNTFIQPFVAYTTPDAWTYAANIEATYNWDTSEWSAPLNLTVAKLVTLGGRPVSLTGGVGYWLANPDGQADDWRFRLVVTYLFPK